MDIKMIIIALVLGVLFGFALNKAGLTKYHKIVNQFRLTDMAVLKFMLTALQKRSTPEVPRNRKASTSRSQRFWDLTPAGKSRCGARSLPDTMRSGRRKGKYDEGVH